jgi:hypothetical protein
MANNETLQETGSLMTSGTKDASGTGIKFEGLDPVLGTLGVMIGLLTKDTTAEATYELNINWFTNPYHLTIDGITKNSKEFGTLLGQLLGSVGGNAIGVPEKDPALLGTWYPIQKKNSVTALYEPSGLYIVTIDNETPGVNGADPTFLSTAIGVGVLKRFENIAGVDINADVWASLPVVVIKADGSFELTFTDTENINPVSIGLAVQGADPASPMINEAALQFNGVKFNGNLFIAPSPKFEVSIDVLALKLANDDVPRNYSLADLQEITPLEVLDTVVNLFTGALAKKFPTQSGALSYVAPLFGFSASVPETTNTLPLMQWVELFQAAVNGGDVSQPFYNWFNQMSASPEILQTWLTCFSGVLGFEGAALKVNGQGTRTQPYQAPMLQIAGVGQINFNLGTSVVGDGNRFLYPGLSYTSEALPLAADAVDFMMVADLELAQFQLSTVNGAAVAPALELNFTANFNLVGANGAPLLDNVQGITIEKLAGGIAIGALSGTVVPHFELINLTLPAQFGSDVAGDDQADQSPNQFGSVNLLSTDELANVGAAALSGELQKLLLGDSGTPGGFRTGIAVLVGLIKPTGAPDTWATPPFSVTGMITSITDPINQWASYYFDVLTSTEAPGGVRPFTYMLQDFANMLQLDGVTATVSGGGTQASPWVAGLSVSGTDMPVNLTAYEVTTGDIVELVFGISLAPEIVLGGVTIIPSVDIDAVHIVLEKGQPTATTWFHGIGAKLTLPHKMTATLADVTISASKAQVSGGWQQKAGLSWSLHVAEPTLTIGTSTPIVGADLNFSQQDSWMDLVDGSAATFGPFFTGALGIGMMHTNTRPGFMVAASLGLLTDFSSYPIYQNSGLDWTGFSPLLLTSFTDPLKVLTDQVASNLSTPAKSKTFLSLISWVITNATTAPDISGDGTFLKPFQVPLPGGFDLPVWYDVASSVIGVGLAKNLSYDITVDSEEIDIAVSSRINCIEFNLDQGAVVSDSNAPSLFLDVLISDAAGGSLIDLPASLGTLGQLQIGFEVNIVGGNLSFAPTVTLLNSQLEGQSAASDISLIQYLAEPLQLRSAFISLLNAGIQKAFELVKEKELFQDVYTLLSKIGLTFPYNFAAPAKDAVLGINPSGWEALLASPLTFMETQMIAFLQQDGAVASLLKLVNTLTGFQFPTIPGPALDLLSGLGLVGSKADNYPVNLKTLLSVVTNPVNELEQRFKSLFTDEVKRKALAKQLTQNIPDETFGPLTLSANSNGVVTLGITEGSPINIGSYTDGAGESQAVVALTGALTVNFSDETASVEFATQVPSIDIALQSIFSVAVKNNAVQLEAPAISLVFGNDTLPSAPALNLLPIPENVAASTFYLDQFKLLAPAYASNIILNAIFESELLNKYPLVQQIFELLGIAKPSSPEELGAGLTTAAFKMQSILGFLLHPVEWILSDDVLGTDGKFDIVKLATALGKIPEKSFQPTGAAAAITVGPNAAKNGMTITGLPYGFHIDISGDTTVGSEQAVFSFGSSSLQIADSASVEDLIFSVNVTPAYQAAVSGGVKLATTAANGLFLDFAYDKDFNLSFGTGTPAAPATVIQLLPFIGWGALAGQAGTLAATKIIETVVPIILDKVAEKAPDFAAAMRTFGTDVPVQTLINSIANIISTQAADGAAAVGKAIEAAALAWLKTIFDDSSGQLTKTTAAVQGIFTLIPPAIGTVTLVAGEDGLLQFTPGINLPIDLFFGVDKKSNLGIWAGLVVPKIPYLNVKVLRTGIGIDLATLKNIDFSFGFELILPIDGQYGPGLTLNKTSTAANGGAPVMSFSLMLDPMAKLPVGETPGAASALAIELAPILFGVNGNPPADIAEAAKDWLLGVLQNVLPRYISILLLNEPTVRSWLDYDLFEPLTGVTAKLTAAELLLATTIIESEKIAGGDEVNYVLNTIDNIKEITPISFLSHLLKLLLDQTIDIVKFGETGVISIGPKTTDADNTFYGINISAPDFVIESAPNIVLQLGATDDTWMQKTYPTGGLKPGIQFYLPIIITADSVEANFGEFNIILGNVGLDVVGKNGQPIIDYSRFKLGAFQPRTLLDLQFNGASAPDVVFGGNLTLAEMALSLAPGKLDSGSADGTATNSTNPIASNLLGSGSEPEDGKSNETATPGFSLQAAYTYDFTAKAGKPYVTLASATGEGTEIMFPIQRAFGPLFIDELGVGWDATVEDKPMLDILFTGDVDIAGLKIDLIGLDVGIPVTTPTDFGAYTIDLDGLDVSYNGGAVSMSGGLLKEDNPLQYSGSALIKASTFSVMALGAYAQIKDSNNEDVTSLFIFGALNTPLGGPPAFFINGLAAGFGFNRGIKIPPVEEVMNFPLVTGVLNGSFSSGDSPESGLAALGDLVPPVVGEYWVAAGLKFKSFELINTAALLFIQFGNNFEINILGLSYAALPPEVEKESALAYFELAIKVSIKPSAGVVSVEAQLTPNSFILSKECKVTGGFAFYLWYKNTTQLVDGEEVPVPSGQFVVSLGGYHPKFKAPKYYPKVPRLGLQWKMDFGIASVSITGETYFAICPTAVMAGGYLDATFKAGPLKAWFNAYANFLIEWKPFYFSVEIGITVGASFGTTIGGVDITLSVQMSAMLELAGPPIGGKVAVDWTVISFTIPFGDKDPETSPNNLASWDAFADSFLPNIEPEASAGVQKSLVAAVAPSPQQVLKWNSGAGLQNPKTKAGAAADPDAPWIVDIMFYSFDLASAVPINVFKTQTDSTKPTIDINGSTLVGVRPMGFSQSLEAPVSFVLKDHDGLIIDVESRSLLPVATRDGSPSALWAQSVLLHDVVPNGDDLIIPSTLVGAQITADTYTYNAAVDQFDISTLDATSAPTKLLPFALTPKYAAAAAGLQQNQYTQIKESIMSSDNGGVDVITARNDIYSALATVTAINIPMPATASSLQQTIVKTRNQVEINAPLSPDLSIMASSAELIFQVFPIIAPIGIYQNNGEPTAWIPYAPALVMAKSKAMKVDEAPLLEGALRRHTSGVKTKDASGKGSAPIVNSKWTGRSQLELNKMKSERLKKTVTPDTNQRLYEGGAYLWRVSPNQIHKVTLSGNLSALAYCFDTYDNLIAKVLIPVNQEVSLAPGTARVAILAHDPNDHKSVGWNRNIKVTKINSKWAMSDGCLIYVQNAQRAGFVNKKKSTGVILMDRLLRQNKVLNRADVLVQGWIQTTCFTASKMVGILTDSSEQDALLVSATANSVPNILGDSKCVDVKPYGDLFLHIYDVAQDGDKTQAFSGVIAKGSNENVTIHGVHSIAELTPESLDSTNEKVTQKAMNISAPQVMSSKLILTH